MFRKQKQVIFEEQDYLQNRSGRQPADTTTKRTFHRSKIEHKI